VKRLCLVLFVFGAIVAFGQSAFDGTWKGDPQSAEFKGNDKYSLQDGMYRCDTCVPKIAVKADGQDHGVSGSPYIDTTNVQEMNDHTVQITSKKNGKQVGSTKLTASEDGKTLTTEWSFVAESGKEGSGKTVSERVGEATAGGNKISGTWKPGKVEDVSANVITIIFETTADGLSMSDPIGDSYTAKFDGKDYPYKGDPGITSVSLKKIDANTIEETDKRNGKVTAVVHMTVSGDGKTMKFLITDKLRNTTANWTAEKQ
jgi:hypothetical protein